jgi:hypothetical protein
MAEEFKQHDQQAGSSFISMLNVQEAAKLEFETVTGKVHGFNGAWAEAVGISKATVVEYNRLASRTVELRKKHTGVGFSGLSRKLLGEYVASPDEVQEVVQELLTKGEKITPKDIRIMREPVVIDDEPAEEVWHDELEGVRAIRNEKQFRAEMATMPVKPMIVDDSYLSDLVALASSACFHINNYEFRGGKTVTAEKLADMFVIEMNRFAEKTDDPQEAYAERHGQCLRGLPLLLEAVQLISSNKPAKLTVIK